MAALTKADLAETLCVDMGLNKREAKDFVDFFFEAIRRSLESGENVRLSGFGNYELRDKPARPGRNPKTGKSVPIEPRRVVTFKASQKFKDFITDRKGHLDERA